MYQVESLHGVFDNICEDNATYSELNYLAEVLARKQIDLVINLPMRNSFRSKISLKTFGYQTRRLAVEYAVPLITDIKCAKLLIEVSCRHYNILDNLFN